MKTSTTVKTLVGSKWEYDGNVVEIIRFGAHPVNLEPLVFCKTVNGVELIYAYDDFFANFTQITKK